MKLTRQFTRRERVLLVILAVLLLFAVYFLTVHIPVTEALEQAQMESESLSTDIMVLEAKQARMEQMQRELDILLAQPNVAEIPSYDNLDRVMDYLNTVLSTTEEYSLSFQGLQQPEDSIIIYREMQMTYVSPSYQAAREVMEQLQNCPYRCQLSGLTMVPSTRDGQTLNPDAVLTNGPVLVHLVVTFFESSL